MRRDYRERPTLPGYITTEEVMKIVRRNRETVYIWRRKGLIKSIRTPNGMCLYERASVEARVKTTA